MVSRLKMSALASVLPDLQTLFLHLHQYHFNDESSLETLHVLTELEELPEVLTYLNHKRKRRDQGTMYLPLRPGGGAAGGGSQSCPSYADSIASTLTQMAFASLLVTAFNAVANIANNINNNNNNLNGNINNNIASNNVNIASSSVNANQGNVIVPPPIPGKKRRKKRSLKSNLH